MSAALMMLLVAVYGGGPFLIGKVITTAFKPL